MNPELQRFSELTTPPDEVREEGWFTRREIQAHLGTGTDRTAQLLKSWITDGVIECQRMPNRNIVGDTIRTTMYRMTKKASAAKRKR